MIRIWARMAWLTAILAVAALGCRTPPPNTKPPNTPEVLNPPPAGARFDSPSYPKQAFQEDNVLKKKLLESESSPILPTRGSGMASGMSPGMR